MSYGSLVRRIEEGGEYCIEGYSFEYLPGVPSIWMCHLPDGSQVARLAPNDINLFCSRSNHTTLEDLNLALRLMDCPFRVHTMGDSRYVCHDGRILAPFQHGMVIGKEA